VTGITTRIRSACAALGVLSIAAFVAGCGESGPQKYPLAGKITYGGRPITYGDIRFEPKEGLKNIDTVAFARFRDGQYKTEVVGGPHWVFVRDLTGDVDMGDSKNPDGRAMFRMEYRGEVDLPALDQVTDAKPLEKDIDIPTSHK
jgi:hypothetical protein